MEAAEFTRFALEVYPLAPDFAAVARVFAGEYFHDYVSLGIEGIAAFIPGSSQIAIFNRQFKQIAAFVLAKGQNVKLRAADLVVFDQPAYSVCLEFSIGEHAEVFSGCVNKLENAHIWCSGIASCESIAEVEVNFSCRGNFLLTPQQQVEVDRLSFYFKVPHDFCSLCGAERRLQYGLSSNNTQLRSPPRIQQRILNAETPSELPFKHPKVPERDPERFEKELERSGVQFAKVEKEEKTSPIVIEKFRRDLERDACPSKADAAVRWDGDIYNQEQESGDLLFI